MRNLTNQCFGRLTAVEPIRKEKKKGYIWKCKCSCGGMKEVPAIYLLNGHTKSCGCIKLENKRKQDITGKRWGRLEAVCPTDERDESGSVVWKCVCQCGSEVKHSVNQLRSGRIHSCGCWYQETRRTCYKTRRDLQEQTSVSALIASKKPNRNNT